MFKSGSLGGSMAFGRSPKPAAKPEAKPKRSPFVIDQSDMDDDAPPRHATLKKTKRRPEPEAPRRPPTPEEAKATRRAEKARTAALTEYKPTKRQVSTDLVVRKNKPVDLDEAEEALRSRFGNKAVLIIQQLEDQDTDGAISMLSRSLLQLVVDLIPVAEQNVRDSKGAKGIYQFNQLIASTRELLTDLSALRDKGLLGHRIVERTVRPAFTDIGGQLVLAFVGLEAGARTYMRPEDYSEYKQQLTIAKTSLAQYLEAQYAEIRDQVIASLS